MDKINSPIEMDFFEALAAGDVNRVRAVVGSHPELLNSYDYRSFGATPLTMACFGGRLGLAQTLVELGADPKSTQRLADGALEPIALRDLSA